MAEESYRRSYESSPLEIEGSTAGASGDRDLDVAMLLRERDWLIRLLIDPGRVDITHRGFDPKRGCVIAYEVPYGRFEICIRLKARV